MGSFVARQPNGLLCRFSTIVDTVTDYNMTDEEYVELCAEMAREEARLTIERYLKPFDWVKEYFVPNNMTDEEFNKILEEMSTEITDDSKCTNIF